MVIDAAEIIRDPNSAAMVAEPGANAALGIRGISLGTRCLVIFYAARRLSIATRLSEADLYTGCGRIYSIRYGVSTYRLESKRWNGSNRFFARLFT